MPSTSSEWRCPASVSRASTSPSRHSATEQYSVDVSSARIFTLRDFSPSPARKRGHRIICASESGVKGVIRD